MKINQCPYFARFLTMPIQDVQTKLCHHVKDQPPSCTLLIDSSCPYCEYCFTRSTTGSSIYIGTHSFNLTCSHDRYPSNFKTTFICYYTELSFEVYNFFLSQQAQKWGVIKVPSPKQGCLKKVHFTSLMRNNLNFPTIFWTCSCQSTSMLVFQLKIKQLQVQNQQKKFKL